MWKLKTKTIPVVVGALGIIKKGIQKFIDEIPGKPSPQEMQKFVLTSTTHILPKILSFDSKWEYMLFTIHEMFYIYIYISIYIYIYIYYIYIYYIYIYIYTTKHKDQ